jgi:endonuclease YncB( thermonuclease family)
MTLRLVARNRHFTQPERAVSVCTVGGTDIADWLVRNGPALDWPHFSQGSYAAAQTEAKQEQRGMLAGSFKEPWTYRACRRSGRGSKFSTELPIRAEFATCLRTRRKITPTDC